jgi:hypothetical protein
MYNHRTVRRLSVGGVGLETYIRSGIYVPDDDRWPRHFRGLGIRIEDSVCIQEEGPLVMTTEAVKEVGAHENLVVINREFAIKLTLDYRLSILKP